MRFEREIRELENKLDELKKAASQADEFFEIINVPVVDGCFDDMPKSYGVDGSPYRQVKLYAVTDKKYTHSKAWGIFNGITTPQRLMTKEEIHLLIACGFLRRGDKSFWSSSVYAILRSYAWLFNGSLGSVDSVNRSNTYGVRFVGRP
jgi:hypothetical protein